MDERINSIEFLEKEHEYWFVDSEGKHRQLHGVTGAIGEILGKKFPDTMTVQVATLYGHDVHHECEMWIKKGQEPFTEGAKWLVATLKDFQLRYNLTHFKAELLVSDFEGTASCIDVVGCSDEGDVLFDIKTTSVFNREYCSLQLSVYKDLYEKVYGRKVIGLFVLGTKSQRAFRIINQPMSKIEKILGMNKA